MISCTCDSCGAEATYGIEASIHGVISISSELLHLYKHHICEKCGLKLGLLLSQEERAQKEKEYAESLKKAKEYAEAQKRVKEEDKQ